VNIEDKARRAQALLDDEVLTAVFDKVERESIERLLAMIDPGFESDRLNAINMVHAVRSLRAELKSLVNQAKEHNRPRQAVV
jgi:hypothetical protein